jgi:hypothetical protein
MIALCTESNTILPAAQQPDELDLRNGWLHGLPALFLMPLMVSLTLFPSGILNSENCPRLNL